MQSREKGHKGDKAKCSGFGSGFKGFQEMCEMMSECCKDKITVTDCCAKMGKTFDEMFGKSKPENDRPSQNQK